eukprot:3718362-Rhodomonas_salina.1
MCIRDRLVPARARTAAPAPGTPARPVKTLSTKAQARCSTTVVCTAGVTWERKSGHVRGHAGARGRKRARGREFMWKTIAVQVGREERSRRREGLHVGEFEKSRVRGKKVTCEERRGRSRGRVWCLRRHCCQRMARTGFLAPGTKISAESVQKYLVGRFRQRGRYEVGQANDGKGGKIDRGQLS